MTAAGRIAVFHLTGCVPCFRAQEAARVAGDVDWINAPCDRHPAESYVREAARLLGEDPSPDEVADAVARLRAMPCWEER